MKLLAGTMAAIFSLAINAPVFADTLSRYPIRPDGIGPLKIGMSLKEVEVATGLKITNIERFTGGGDVVEYMRSDIESIGLEFYKNGTNLGYIYFSNPEYKTEEGIKVGDTVQQVISKHPSAKVFIGLEDYHYFLLKDENAKTGLELSLDFLDNNTVGEITVGVVPRIDD
jgi:hypothetical protein